jgi:hypothetical protein
MKPVLSLPHKLPSSKPWGDEEWVPEDLAEALFEMLLAPNPNPSPSNLGFTVVDWCQLN